MPTLFTMPVFSTRYLGPTETRGARIRAASPGGRSAVYSWNHAGNETENHAAAAAALASKVFNWPAESFRLCGGCTADGRYAFTVERIGE